MRALDVSYIRGSCAVPRWNEEGNEDMYGRLGIDVTVDEGDCGMVEWVKCGTMKRYGHVMAEGEDGFIKE